MTVRTTIGRVAEFDPELIADLFRQAGESNTEPNQEFFAGDDNVLLVAYTDGKPSGFAYAYVLRRPHELAGKMLLYSIDVFDPFRRRGIGTRLVSELKRLATVRGCRQMWVPTNRGNVAAVGLYGKTGGKADNGDDVSFIYDLRSQGELAP